LANTFASAQSPDILIFPEENWNSKESADYYKGDHGEATWDNQHNILIISGPGIKNDITSYSPSRLIDIAPTVLYLMDLTPEKVDGIVLADALVNPTNEQIEIQKKTNLGLNPLKEALKLSNKKEDYIPEKIPFVFTRDYFPGTKDSNGNNLSGNELMRIISYKGELFASTSTFTDPRGYTNDPDYTGCQVIRKKDAISGWEVDKSFGKRYLRTDCIEAVRFTKDSTGTPLTKPVEFLAAGIWDIGSLMPGGQRFITIAVRNDDTKDWILTQAASVPTTEKGFASCRAMIVYTDKITGKEYLFAGAACGGMHKGVYDPSAPGKIRWLTGDEVDKSYGRVHSMCVANGVLYASFDYGGLTVQNQSGGIYRRIDGENPAWECVYRMYNPNYSTWNQTDRGITTVPANDGSGKEVILTAVEQPPTPIIVRIEPHNGYASFTELNYAQYVQKYIFNGSYPKMIDATIAGALNYFEPYINPENGSTEYFVTLVLNHPQDPLSDYNGAWFLIRRDKDEYDWAHIPSGLPDGDHLKGSRTVCKSPFADEPNMYYFGGCFAGPSEQPPKPNMAWIYKGILETNSIDTKIYNKLFKVNIYPNPAIGLLNISSLPDNFNGVITICNMMGQQIYSEQHTGSELKIHTGDLQKGIYLVQIKPNNGQVITKKFIKE